MRKTVSEYFVERLGYVLILLLAPTSAFAVAPIEVPEPDVLSMLLLAGVVGLLGIVRGRRKK